MLKPKVALLALVLVLGTALSACSKSSADAFSGAVLHQPYHVPATELADTDGTPYSLANSTDKRLTLVFFGYTHCPDECPTTKVATDVGVPVAKGRRLPSGGYDVTHGTQVLGVDGKNTVPVVWTLGTTAPEFAHDIHQLLN